MIKINKNDSIIDVIIKIKNCKKKEIVLDFPFGHPIIHNHTSLKILKNKAGKKELIIITNDKTARKLGKNLGIKYSQIGDTDLLEYNYSFFEYTKYLFKHYLLEISQLFSKKTPDIIFDYQKKYGVTNGKIGFFLLGLIISILLLIFIFYFAVNKTYIYITPEITIKTRAENFIFKEIKEEEISQNDNIIKLNEVSKLIYITNTFGTSGIDENTFKKSKGKAIFFNELNEQVELLKNTRIQTKDGIIFTTDTNVSIPKAKLSSTGAIIPGEVNINITSKIHDTNGKVVGIRSNIDKGVVLNLPGLKTNTDKIYAKTLINTKGASNDYKKTLTKEDITNAENILESKLKQKALNDLKTFINNENENNNIKYQILGIDGIIKYSDFNIIDKDKLKVGDYIDNFDLSGTIKITSYTYNTEKLLNQLSTTIKSKILTDIEKLLFIDDNSLRISNIISRNDKPVEIKATAQIEAFLSHNFLTKKNNYIKKLKSTISGISKEDAIKILLNNSNISDVKIEIRPFFIKKISKINENIIIKVIDK